MKREASELESATDKTQNELDDMPRYIAGKNPRHNDTIPLVQYDEPLRPKTELYRDVNWGIPQFNLFVTYTIDSLINQYKDIFKDFIKLPSRKFHPQYYYKIEQPISVNEIKSRDYEYPQGNRLFLLDIELLAKNCNAYNDNDSLIVKNSYQMINYIKYEILKAKNIRKNFLINEDVKEKLLHTLENLFNVTEKEIFRELYSDSKGGRNFKPSEPFQDLVDSDELPEYYEVIHRPMALNVVQENLSNDKYSTIYDFIIDVHLIFDNCLVFNDDGTAIYENALLLDEYFDYLLIDFFTNLRDLKNQGKIILKYPTDSNKNFTNEENNENSIERNGTKDTNVNNSESNNENGNKLNADSDKANLSSNLNKNNDNNNKDSVDDINNVDNIENLGNGYTRTLLPKDDYLLGSRSPSNIIDLKNKEPEAPKRKKIRKHDGIMKYNIIKSLKSEFILDENKINNLPFKLIDKISIYTSYSMYQQAMNPIGGGRPPLKQNWVEYDFNMKDLNQNENVYTFSIEPLQIYLTISMNLNFNNLNNSLSLNNDVVQSTNMQDGSTDNKLQKFDIKLNEGLNCLEFQSSNNIDDPEIFKVWINVLP